ncbi:MAG: hypothetical protein PHX61_14215 [Alphaproteobacteria bacterium]|nr:hypothetical protein [Alphaproteobacteria bacterium]
MTGFSLGRRIIHYLSEPDNLLFLQENYEEEILPLYPDPEFRDEIVALLDCIGASLIAPVIEGKDISESQLNLVRAHIRNIACTYIATISQRTFDLCFGLNVHKGVCIDDYVKIKRPKDLGLDTRVRKNPTKTNSRSRGSQLSNFLQNYQPTKKEKFFIEVAPLDLDRATLQYEGSYILFRTIRHLLEQLQIYSAKRIDLAACFWTNRFIVFCKAPIPSRHPKDFIDEWVSPDFERFMTNPDLYKFNLAFWKKSFSNRKPKMAEVRDKELNLPPMISKDTSITFSLNLETTVRIVWLFNLIRVQPRCIRPISKFLNFYSKEE